MKWKSRRRMGKRVAVVSVTAVLLAAMGLSSVRASSSTVACEGIDDATYTPGITETPQVVSVSVRGTYRCRLAGGDVLGGTLTVRGEGTFSCSEGRFSGTITASWDNGRESTMTGGSGVHVWTDTGAAVSGSGRVVSGLFEGSRVRRVVAIDYAGPGCAAAGVTAGRASVVMHISPS